MSTTGFIKLHRQLLEWEWYDDINVYRVFTHLLLKANYKDLKKKGKIIKRGSYLTGRESLAQETNLSVQQVRTALNKLKSTSDITIESTNRGVLINVTNYCLYQDKDEKINQQNNQPVNQQITSNQPANNQQITTCKEEKEYKEGKKGKNNNINVLFEEFWNLYDYKKAKPKAEQAYKKSLKITSHEEIIKGVEAYKKARGDDKQYWKHPTTWLNAQAWSDEYTAKKQSVHDLSEKDYTEGTEGFHVI